MLEVTGFRSGSPCPRFDTIMARVETTANEVEPTVKSIIDQVQRDGDEALLSLTRELDGADLTGVDLTVSNDDIESAIAGTDEKLLSAMTQAAANIRRFHEHQRRTSWFVPDGDGVILGKRYNPIERVGIYIPGGAAPLFSSVLMAAIPAAVAGVAHLTLCTPPSPDGSVHTAILQAANLCGISLVHRVGGAQAIAAMAFGTESIKPVDKIVGPGNAYTVAAKRMVFGQVGIEMLPGPSELVIVADDTANPIFIAADMLSQAEHGSGYEASVLITPSEKLAEMVTKEITRQLETLSRAELVKTALERFGAIFVVGDLNAAYDLCSQLAAEHVEVMTTDPWRAVDAIKCAGAIFLGPASTEPVGDYFCGTNHVLPTGRAARYASSLGVADFLTDTSIIAYTPERLAKTGAQIEVLAEAEGLDAHANAIRVRLNNQ